VKGMRDIFASRLLEMARQDPTVLLITGDLGYGVLDSFANELSDQYLNVGIAEQNMVGIAAGLASLGHKVFVYSIGNFPTLRCLEQIRNDVAYHDLDVNIVAVGGGFSYGSLGMSHHATEDLSVMRSIPKLSILVPGTNYEVGLALEFAMRESGPKYIRLDKSGAGSTPIGSSQTSSWCQYSEGSDLLVIAAGGVLVEALKCEEYLRNEGVKTSVYSATLLQIPKDLDLDQIVRSHRLIATIEENQRVGGLGGLLAEHLSGSDSHPPLLRFGVPSEFVKIAGTQEYFRQVYGLSGSTLAKEILDKWQRL